MNNLRTIDKRLEWERKKHRKYKQAKAVNLHSFNDPRKCNNLISRAISKEILSLHNKGKDVASIAVWTNRPVSQVLWVIENHKALVGGGAEGGLVCQAPTPQESSGVEGGKV